MNELSTQQQFEAMLGEVLHPHLFLHWVERLAPQYTASMQPQQQALRRWLEAYLADQTTLWKCLCMPTGTIVGMAKYGPWLHEYGVVIRPQWVTYYLCGTGLQLALCGTIYNSPPHEDDPVPHSDLVRILQHIIRILYTPYPSG